MNTPICDFVRHYIESNTVRLHMPGHKGASLLGFEAYDLTEIKGADSLYEADGIIAESESNAGSLFGAHTLYSTEGSSQCIRAAVQLLSLCARAEGKRPHILAGRNAHKTFLSAVALLDVDVTWLCPAPDSSYLSCPVDEAALEQTLKEAPAITAVYLTSPDYTGNTVDLDKISRVCRRCGVLLAVDNAHGAYLKFLPRSMHPIDLGADICCDSAHKTLPTLTGGAYLHIAKSAPDILHGQAKNALALFGSTSPSYLILQSLDMTNRYLAEGYPARLAEFVNEVQSLRRRLNDHGYTLCGDEPMKLTISTKPYGYAGTDFAELLRTKGVECEFCDPDFVVLMPSPQMKKEHLEKLETTLLSIPKAPPVASSAPLFHIPKTALSPREASLSVWETLPRELCLGRILAAATVGCPPAVPIAVCGERLDKETLARFAYYGVETCTVVKE